MRNRGDYAEPFRIKSVEPIRMTTRDYRAAKIAEAQYNLFSLDSDDVYIDLLTDSGTGAMSDAQWAAIMTGDEAYAGSRSYHKLRESVKDTFGYEYMLPVHQGRGAEQVLMAMMVKQGDIIPGNMHFDTTIGHILLKGGVPLDLVAAKGYEISSDEPFKGDIDLAELEKVLSEQGDKVPFVLMTITCNSNGGQPVSMANIKEASRISRKYGKLMFFDCARFAENSCFIKMREKGYSEKSVLEIARETFGYGDGCMMSSKKDGLVNIGGLLCFKDQELYRKAWEYEIPYEGFITYGGMAGRDMAALAQGLREVVQFDYLEDRLGQVAYLAGLLSEIGVPVILPSGGHGVFVDAKAYLPHIPQVNFPAQALGVELYIEGGVRGVELGSCAFGHTDPETGLEVPHKLELLRLAIPRRTYTDRHMQMVAKAFERIEARKGSIAGYKIVWQAEVLRHFTAKFAKIDE